MEDEKNIPEANNIAEQPKKELDEADLALLMMEMERESQQLCSYPRYVAGVVAGVMVFGFTLLLLYFMYYAGSQPSSMPLWMYLSGGVIAGGTVWFAVTYYPAKNS